MEPNIGACHFPCENGRRFFQVGPGAVRDFPFPTGDGTMKSVLTADSAGTKRPKAGGMTVPPQPLAALSSQWAENKTATEGGKNHEAARKEAIRREAAAGGGDGRPACALPLRLFLFRWF